MFRSPSEGRFTDSVADGKHLLRLTAGLRACMIRSRWLGSSLERTLVDVLDAPRHGGGWEELWLSLESVEFFDLDAVIDYAFKLDSAATVARVGLYLEQHREPLMVDKSHLERLQARAPRQPIYLERGKRESGRLLPRWNIVVPERILSRAWAEVA